MHVFQDASHFDTLLATALDFRNRTHLSYIKSLESKSMIVLNPSDPVRLHEHAAMDAVCIDDLSSIKDYDLAILVQDPYARECVPVPVTRYPGTLEAILYRRISIRIILLYEPRY